MVAIWLCRPKLVEILSNVLTHKYYNLVTRIIKQMKSCIRTSMPLTLSLFSIPFNIFCTVLVSWGTKKQEILKNQSEKLYYINIRFHTKNFCKFFSNTSSKNHWIFKFFGLPLSPFRVIDVHFSHLIYFWALFSR